MNKEEQDYILCIVAVEGKEHKTFYLGIRGRDLARKMQDRIAHVGFLSEDKTRYFPDQIESLTLKVKDDEKIKCLQSSKHQEINSRG